MLNNRSFYSYIDAIDAEFMAIESACDIDMAVIKLASDYNEKVYDINLRKAELKVLTEGGTYDDIDMLYNEAGKAASEKEGSFLSRAIDRVIKFFSDIADAIHALFTGKRAKELQKAADNGEINETIKIKEPNAIIQAISTAVNKLTDLIKPEKPITVEDSKQAVIIYNNAQSDIAKLTPVAITIGALIAGGIALSSAFTSWKEKLNSLKERAEKAVKNHAGAGAQGILDAVNKLLKLGKDARSAVTKPFSVAYNAFLKVKGGEDTGKEDEAEAEAETSDRADADTKTDAEEAKPEKKTIADKAKTAGVAVKSAGTNAGNAVKSAGNAAGNALKNAGGAIKGAASSVGSKLKKESVEDTLDNYDVSSIVESCDDILNDFDSL